MKKSLLAVAALGAFASAAQAQSSVTVYGILDVGYTGSNSSIVNGLNTGGAAATVNYPATTATGGTSGYLNNNLKQTQSLFGQSAEQTSRLGFKGNEDLGGGTSAFFTVEFGLRPQEQTVSGNTVGGLNNRQTFVGLKKNGLGDAAIGTQYQPIHVAIGKTDPGQQNNMTGSVIYTGQSDSGVVGNVGGNTNAYQSRFSNSITFNSEVMSGFQLHAMGVLKNANATQVNNSFGQATVGGNTNTNGWALGLDYTWNKLFATANYTSMKQLTTVCNITNTSLVLTSTTSCATGSGASSVFAAAEGGVPAATAATMTASTNASNQGVNIVDNTAYVGATYDFGILKAYASWINRKASGTANSAEYQKRTAQQIGVRSYITPTIESWASAGVGNFTPMGFNQNSAHFAAWQLGSNYWLSKRTNLYAIFGQYNQANSTYQTGQNAVTGAGGTTYQTSVNANSYAVGVRHTF